jgi:LPXTG-motif cell wall-anchored protein
VLTESSDVEISGNTVSDATDGSGIFLGLGNDGVTVSDNVLESAAVPADDTSAIRISNAFGTGASQDYTITGNQITGGWSHAIRRSAGAYAGVLAPRGNQFGMVVTNDDPDNAIDADGNWWDPSIDHDSMPNVTAAEPCATMSCQAAPGTGPTASGPTLPATGVDPTPLFGFAGGAVLIGLAAMFAARRRGLKQNRA